MFRIESIPRTGSPTRVRVDGSLTGPVLNLLFERLGPDQVILDLSQVQEADAAAAGFLAHLGADRCAGLVCPAWLARWIHLERRLAPPAERRAIVFDSDADGRAGDGQTSP